MRRLAMVVPPEQPDLDGRRAAGRRLTTTTTTIDGHMMAMELWQMTMNIERCFELPCSKFNACFNRYPTHRPCSLAIWTKT